MGNRLNYGTRHSNCYVVRWPSKRERADLNKIVPRWLTERWNTPAGRKSFLLAKGSQKSKKKVSLAPMPWDNKGD